jgi:hypothetical protein
VDAQNTHGETVVTPHNTLPMGEQWPTILVPKQSAAGRSSKWLRDMGEIVMALPEATVIARLMDYFFDELSVSSECTLSG